MSRLSRHDRSRRARARKQRRTAARQSLLECDGWDCEGLITEATGEVSFLAAGDGAPADAPKRFHMVLYRGGRMRPAGAPYDVIVDLSGAKVAGGPRPSYLDHDRSRIVGHCDISVTDGKIVADGYVSGGGEAAAEVLASSAKGFPWRSSIGAHMENLVFVEKGETAAANGNNWQGPCFILRACTIQEGSFVSIAGDNSSTARIAAGAAAQSGALKMFEAWLTAKGFDAATITDAQRKWLEAQFEAEQSQAEPGAATVTAAGGAAGAVTTPPVGALAAAGQQVAPTFDRQALINELRASAVAEIRGDVSVEMQRHARIRHFADKYGVTNIQADGAEVDFVAHAIDKGWTVEKAELEAMRGGRPHVGPAVHVATPASANALEAALCLSGGMEEQLVARSFGESSREQVMNQAQSADLRGAKITTLMHDTIRAAGMHARPGLVNDDFIRTALRADRQLQAAGPATISLSGILGNVANKALQAQYRAVADVVHRIAAKSTAVDFKPMTRYRLTGDATFLEVGANGEIKSFELGEESYTNAIKTYGRMIMLNRQMMRNDDLGAFLQLPIVLGRGAALCRNKGFFTTLLANPGSFFALGSGNYIEGAATVLSITSLTLAEQKFLEMKDAKGNFIEAMPALLLTAPANKVVAEQLHNDTFVNETTTANAPKPASNPHAGKFDPVSTPYLGASSGIVGASDLAWYLLAAPSDVPVAEIAYLDGNETPVLQSSEADFDVLGVKWRSFWDFGVAMANKTGGVKSKGAA